MLLMTDIVLATFNAKYIHTAFGLRYLMANLGDLQPRAKILEFNIHQSVIDVAEQILREEPKIVGVGVYIWNAALSSQLVTDLKRLRPELIVIIGGPEVSYEIEQQAICREADYVITGEADLMFAEVCRGIIVGQPLRLPSIVPGGAPALQDIALPYSLYSDEDIAHRVTYVEASRGCPFECEFCLSSLDVPVRNARLEPFLAEMEKLLDRGCRQFKFVDRTFNLNLKFTVTILQFFLDRYRDGLFLHFEMIPDRLPRALRAIIEQFPPGAMQLEIGIQTFNEHVAELISRRQDNAKVAENLRWLREHTGVHVHADLIAGLPGEDLGSFAAGFDRLVALRPQETQVGILKRLRGTPIVRHDREWGMVYNPEPPYEILQTKLIDFFTMRRLCRFARYWDLVANSGNFIETGATFSTFENFMRFSDWLYAQTRQTHSIARARLAELLKQYLGRPVKLTTHRRSSRQAKHLARQP